MAISARAPPRMRGNSKCAMKRKEVVMSMEFASANLTAGQLNAIVKKLGGEEGALRLLRGELVVSEPERCWREQDGVIYFSVTSDGATGEEWIVRLESKGFRVDDCTKGILCSPDFKPTNGTTEVAVLKGMLFNEDERITNNIRAKAHAGEFTQGRELSDPNAELACLIREKFLDEEIESMGLWVIVAMHEPIKDSGGNPDLLYAYRRGDGGWLYACWVDPYYRWSRDRGFAFSLSQVRTQD